MSHPPTFEVLSIPAELKGRAWSLRARSWWVFHRHAELEVNLVTSGYAVYLIGERRYRMTRRTMLWLYPEQDHALVEQSDDFAMHLAVWRPQFLDAICTLPNTRALTAQNCDNAQIRQIETEDFTNLVDLWNRFEQAAHSDHYNALLGLLALEAKLAFDRGEANIAGKNVHPAVERAAKILVQRSVELEILAREVGLSPSRLSRLFKSQIGVSISHFRAQKQIERFMGIYDGQNYSLTEAALLAGFGSYAQFNRVFREMVGYNPTTHRQKLRNNSVN